MKRLSLFFGILLMVTSIHAQDVFRNHGFDKEMLTLSKGKYKEVFTNDEVVQIGTVLLNTKNNEVIRFLEEESPGISYKEEYSSRFLTIDPLAEKYPWISPYAYCLNNPIKYIDPDGRDVVITGTLSNEALEQLQNKVGKYITLSINESGNVSYSMNEGVNKLKGDAKRMAGMIDDSSITVNLVTTDKNVTSTGNLMIGGTFMGNTVTTDADGNVTVSARQEVNPNVLGSADAHTKTPGKMMMHEATEAYEGAKISQKTGVSSPYSNMPGTVYEKAHNRATPQTALFETIYDNKGNKLQMLPGGVYPPNTARAEWYVTKYGKSKIILTLP